MQNSVSSVPATTGIVVMPSLVAVKPRFALLALAACLIAGGCDSRDSIATYSVPKDWVRDELRPPTAARTADAPGGRENRIVGAILPQRSTFWFFKLSGPPPAVARQVDAVKQFLSTVQLSDADQAEPQWTLPSGWKQLPATAMRFATLEIPDVEQPLELAVSSLPLPPETSADAFLLSNLNRWRGQVQLQPLGAEELPRQTEKLLLSGQAATFVDIQGKLGAGGMPGMRAAGPAGDSASGSAQPSARGERSNVPRSTPSAGDAAKDLRYDLPSHWKEAPNDGFSAKAFVIAGEEESTARVTLSPLAGSGGDLRANINRWRSQVALPPLAEAELASALTPIEVDRLPAQYAEIVGEGGDTARAVLGVILPRRDATWFIKMTGPATLVLAEKEHFQAFVKSLHFEP